MPTSPNRLARIPALLGLVLVLGPVAIARAGTITYSGRLSDSGRPAQGSYALRLTPYSSRTGATRAGAPIELGGVELRDGRFQATVDLGALTERYDTLWLAVEVAGADGAFSALPGREALATMSTASACWDTAGNALAGGEFIGSTNGQPFEVHVNNDRSLRIEAAQSGNFVAPNVTTGASDNLIQASAGSVIGGGGGTENGAPVGNQVDSIAYGTIGGGLRNHVGDGSANANNGDFGTIAGGVQNHVYGDSATVGGGYDNSAAGFRSVVGGGISNASNNTDSTIGGGNANLAAGDQSVIAGGESNETNATWSSVGGGVNNAANAQGAVVSGGVLNVASGATSTVPGGYDNTASGISSYAAGVRARAKYQGMYVWSDDSNLNAFNPARSNIDPTGLDNGWAPASNSYNVRATGGVWFITAMSGNNGIGAYINPGSGTWSSTSSRAFKTAIEGIDTGAILDAVVALPLSYWRYATETGVVRHLGPFAEDFARAFALGPDDRSITSVDADGVALAAIQGLNASLRREIARRDAELARRDAELERLRDEGAALAARLDRLERSHVESTR